MTSNRPYLLRALYEWITDNDLTPHILVDAEVDGVNVPEHVVQQGKVVLNISPVAVRELEMGNDWLVFTSRFSGKSHLIHIPVSAVIAVYARENGQGMMFTQDDGGEAGGNASINGDPADQTQSATRSSHLKLIK